MKVVIPSPLISYTHQREVEAAGSTLGELVADLDRRFPGVRFRMIDEQDSVRPHILIFVNGRKVRDLATVLESADQIQIIQALSGG